MAIQKTVFTGAAGEHYIMYRLLEMGYVAGLAPDGTPDVDLVVSHLEAGKSIAIQVKTRRPKGSDNGWHMKPKHETLISSNLFYCFVDLPDDPQISPITYIVPSKIVADAIREMHVIWLGLPGKNGQPHKDSNVRRLLPNYTRLLKNHPDSKKYGSGWLDIYKENWDGLGLK